MPSGPQAIVRKYLAGFQIIPDGIPDFAPIKFDQVKISMRVSPSMEAEKSGRDERWGSTSCYPKRQADSAGSPMLAIA